MNRVGVAAERQVETSAIPRFLDVLIFYGLCGLVILLALPYGAVEPWWVAIFECVVFIFAILDLIYRASSNASPRIELSLLMPLVLLALFALVQSMPLFPTNAGALNANTALSADPFGTRLFVIRLAALIVFAVLLMGHTTSRRRLRVLVKVVIGVALASALFGMLRKDIQQRPGFILPYLTMDGGFAQFINKNHFAFLMEMAFGLSIGLLAGQVRRDRRSLLLLPIVVVLWIALIYSNSRGGIMASLCQLLFLGVMLDTVRKRGERRTRSNRRWFHRLASGAAVRLLLVFCLVVCFALGIGWVGGEPVTSNFAAVGNDFGAQSSPEPNQESNQNRSNSSRRQIWAATWQLIKEHPVAGVGFGGYWTAITKYHNASGELTPQQAHNEYLELSASGGLIGVALFIWFMALFVIKARDSLHTPDLYRCAAVLGALIGIFGVAIHSFVDFGLHITINSVLFVMLLVISIVGGRDYSQRETKGAESGGAFDDRYVRQPARVSL